MDSGKRIGNAIPVREHHSGEETNTPASLYFREADPFSEDETELRVLRSKPTCFLIVGKPGVGKTTLARVFAQEWRCELVNSTALILRHMERGTELGREYSELLFEGKIVPEELVFRIIQDKMLSPEVAHHGYVVDDLPCVSESTMTITDQMAMIKKWKLQPDFIINLEISDEDLLNRRHGLKADPVFGQLYSKDTYSPEKPVKQTKVERGLEEEEEEAEEEEDEEYEATSDEEAVTGLPENVVERLVTRPEDMDPHVEETLNRFHTNVAGPLHDYIQAHDQECIINLDANLSPRVVAKQLLTKLQCYLVSPAVVVRPLKPMSEEEEDEPDESFGRMNTDDIMRALAPKGMVAPKFRWRRSRWLQYCPVQLYDGKKVLGKPEFAVRKRSISMELQSPRRLQDLCIDLMAEKLSILWRQKDGSQFFDPDGVEWRDSEQFLHSQLADKLLQILSDKGRLTNGILNTFTQKHTLLQNVKITSCNNTSKDWLQVLSHHKLISLHLSGPLPLKICAVLQCIGNKSYESLQHLILQKNPYFDEVWPHDFDLCGQSVIRTLSRFNCLKSVDISGSGLSNTNLAILAKSLLHVENLNLSKNFRITDVSPLRNCQKTLKSLSLFELSAMTAESAMATFVTLTDLTYLDVSLHTTPIEDFFGVHDSLSHRHLKKVFTADELLQIPDVLPNLVCLDLSRRTVRNEQAFRRFLDTHQSLQMLMLWTSPACQFKSLQDYRPRLTVGGSATLEQYAVLLRYWTRTGKHRDMMKVYIRGKQYSVMRMITRDLLTKSFPPCHDDQLVQAMLGVFSHPSPFKHQMSYLIEGSYCLEAIFVLLDKGIIRRLEPDTKRHLLQVCRRAVQWSDADFFNGFAASEFARSILQAVGEPENPDE